MSASGIIGTFLGILRPAQLTSLLHTTTWAKSTGAVSFPGLQPRGTGRDLQRHPPNAVPRIRSRDPHPAPWQILSRTAGATGVFLHQVKNRRQRRLLSVDPHLRSKISRTQELPADFLEGVRLYKFSRLIRQCQSRPDAIPISMLSPVRVRQSSRRHPSILTSRHEYMESALTMMPNTAATRASLHRHGVPF